MICNKILFHDHIVVDTIFKKNRARVCDNVLIIYGMYQNARM